jgi:dolichol-phosphate mannosyltransferase
MAAVVWNFALADSLRRFFVMGNADLLVRIPLLALLVSGLHLGVLAGNLLTLLASFLVRFFVSDKLIYVAGRKS